MRFKATVAYDGHAYAGFQKQSNGLGIQSILEEALEKIIGIPTPIVASGRTDAKVHALGQVFHFDGPANIHPYGYYNALNTLLPKDIRIIAVEEVPDDFHARFWAIQKHYEYIITQERDNPFVYPYKHFVWRSLNLEVMKQGAHYLEGTHDFTSFCCAQIDPRKSRIKTISKIEIIKQGQDIHIHYYGNGFLRYQVRMMSAALIALGEGKITLEQFQEILEAKDKHACRFNAPAKGLYLVEVKYGQNYKAWPEDKSQEGKKKEKV